MGFLAAIGAFLGSGSIADSAAKIIDKIAGTDFTSKEKAQFILDYQNATKHQSPARRMLACSVGLTYLLCVLIWMLGLIYGVIFHAEEGITLANQVKIFMADTIKEPFNYVIMFYFALGAVSRLGK